LKTLVVSDASEATAAVAAEIAALIDAPRPRGESATLGLATGDTPLGVYAELVRRSREGLDLTCVTTFNLDEYVGLAGDHPSSFAAFMRRNLFEPAGIDDARAHIPKGNLAEADLEDHCAEYERAIAAAGGIDLQLLGLGRNGHIAFNEPGTDFDSRTHVQLLTDGTRTANARGFSSCEAVPTRAVTMGLGTIREARRVRLLAFGSHKAAVVERLLRGPVETAFPASCLRDHPDAILWIDEAAGERMR
jgi:glucosamine-6-phosphate deaminase